MNTKIFSGEPLPTAPPESNADRASFDRKLLDYLRRLTAKIAVVTTGGTPTPVESFVSTLSTNQDEATDLVPFDVKWNRDIHFNSEFFQHSVVTNPEIITVIQDGVYQIEFDVQHYFKSSGLSGIVMIAGLTVDYSHWTGSASSFGDILAGNTGNLSVGIPMVAGTSFKIQLTPYIPTSNPGGIYKAATRISVVRIADIANGGTGGGLGWDSNPPSWLS